MKLLKPLLICTFIAGAVVISQPSEMNAQTVDPKAEKKAARLKAKAEAKAKAEEAKKAEAEAPPKVTKVEPPKPKVVRTQDVAALSRLIDTQVDAKLKAGNIAPSGICTDEEFLRRAYLDITGVIPTFDKAKAFLDDKSADKRSKLVDELLRDENYGRKLADLWITKLYPRESSHRFITKAPLYRWLMDQFNANTPWDTFTTKLLTASGSVDKNPEVMFFLANRSVDKLTDTTTQHFMGVKLACAQCHNHPFTQTKQTEYWGMAAFYSKVQPQNPKNTNKGGDNSTLAVAEGTGPSRVKDFFPESTKTLPPKYLSGSQPDLKSTEPYRPALVQWMTAQDNPFFAKAMVNKVWAAYFGNGIVDPIDDMIETNKPSHPELLQELSEHFAYTGFDLKYLVRGIVLSNAYQRSSKPAGNNQSDSQLFSHMNIKVMSAEQLFDSSLLVLGAEKNANPNATRKPNVQVGGKGAPAGRRDQFIQFFTAGAEEISLTEYEIGIPQVLRLINSKTTNNPQVVRQFVSPGAKPAEVIEKIYLSTLSRRPTAAELEKLTAYVGKSSTALEAYSDILWAVMNGTEFTVIK